MTLARGAHGIVRTLRRCGWRSGGGCGSGRGGSPGGFRAFDRATPDPASSRSNSFNHSWLTLD